MKWCTTHNTFIIMHNENTIMLVDLTKYSSHSATCATDPFTLVTGTSQFNNYFVKKFKFTHVLCLVSNNLHKFN